MKNFASIMEDICETTTKCRATGSNESLNEATPAQFLQASLSKETESAGKDTASDDAISSTTPDKFSDNTSSMDNFLNIGDSSLNADFFADDLKLSNMPATKCNENVEDIVQDLENLLGESNDNSFLSLNRSSKSNDDSSVINSCSAENLLAEENSLSDILVNSSHSEFVINKKTVESTSTSDEVPSGSQKLVLSDRNKDFCEQVNSSEESIVTTVCENVVTYSNENVDLNAPSDAIVPSEEVDASGETIVSSGETAVTIPDVDQEVAMEISDLNTFENEAVTSALNEDVGLFLNEETSNIFSTEENNTIGFSEETNLAAKNEEIVSTVLKEDLISSPHDTETVALVTEAENEVTSMSKEDDVSTSAEETEVEISKENEIITESTTIETNEVVPLDQSEDFAASTDNEMFVDIPSENLTTENSCDNAVLEILGERDVELNAVISNEKNDLEILDEEAITEAVASVSNHEDFVMDPSEDSATSNDKLSLLPNEDAFVTQQLEEDTSLAAPNEDSASIPSETGMVSDVVMGEASGDIAEEESTTGMLEDTNFVNDFDSSEIDDSKHVDSNPFQLPMSHLEDSVGDIEEAVSSFERSFNDASLQQEVGNSSQASDDLSVACDSSILQINFDSQPEVLDENDISPSNIVDSVVAFPEGSTLEPDETMEIDTLILAAQESLARNKELPLISSTIDEPGSLNIEENLPSLDVLQDVQSTDEILMETNSNPTFENISECFDIDMKSYDEESNQDMISGNTLIQEENPTSSSQAIGPLTVEVEESEEFKTKIKDDEPTDGKKDSAEVTDSSSEQDQSSSEASELNRAPLIMTIAKHKSNNTHSILKIYEPEESQINLEEQPAIPRIKIRSHLELQEIQEVEEPTVPKITIKPIINPNEPHSPRKSAKSTEASEKPNSPRITIKPIAKPETPISPLKLTIKPYPKLEERQNSPKLTIKPIPKPTEESSHSDVHHSPKITIKPIIKPSELEEERSSPRLTIKPIVKSDDSQEDSTAAQTSFKLSIKPIVRPPGESLSPKITIKPVQKPPDNELTANLIDFEEQIKQERIVLKINKNAPKKADKLAAEAEKLKKIKVKLSKEGGTARIVPSRRGRKRQLSDSEECSSNKRLMTEDDIQTNVVRKRGSKASLAVSAIVSSNSPATTTQSMVTDDKSDPLSAIPVFEISLQSGSRPKVKDSVVSSPGQKKRGRPRKVPLVVREDFKDPLEPEIVSEPVVETVTVVPESSRPKRSCRESSSSVRLTLGMKPRKPRGPSTRGGRGGNRNVGNRTVAPRKAKEFRSYTTTRQKISKKLLIKEEPKEEEVKEVEFKPVPIPPAVELRPQDVSIYEEETRMSADNSNSRAHTPAKQVLVATTSSEVFDESQSSIQSNTTTESGDRTQKSQRKGSRIEIQPEPEGEVISADKLAEYSWGGGGPYMLQEQVAQFLGIKSFKRKYPGIERRAVDMQERDFIRESSLASEAMCDMGLTAVKSEDILDIMYSDFQNKYEEYCKYQRDRQAKDVSNKQKALSLAASQEKNKINIVEEAMISAYVWNVKFNEARKEERKACMDLQTYTINYPRSKMKQVNKPPPPGHYPLSLVPGQYTDYYKVYTPEELLKLPINTINHNKINFNSNCNQDTEESQSDDSGSDSDSSSSDSDSSCSDSSDAENCKKCISRGPVKKVAGRGRGD